MMTDRRLTNSPVAASNISRSGTSSEISVAVGAAVVVVVAGTSVVVVVDGSVVVVVGAAVVVVGASVVVVVSAAKVVVVDGSVGAAVSSEAMVDEVVAGVVGVVSGSVAPGEIVGGNGRLGGAPYGRLCTRHSGGRAVGSRVGGRISGVSAAGHNRAEDQRHSYDRWDQPQVRSRCVEGQCPFQDTGYGRPPASPRIGKERENRGNRVHPHCV